MNFNEIKETVEFFFLPSDFNFSHKISNEENEHSEPVQTMTCYLTKEGLDGDDSYELSIQLEDESYINLHLKKIIKHNPFEIGFVNYLTNIGEMTATLSFFSKLYLR